MSELSSNYLVLNAAAFPLAALLADHYPPEAILGTATDLRWAGRVVSAFLHGERLSADGQPVEQVLVRTTHPVEPGAFEGPGLVMHYDNARKAGSYLHRFLCGNWPACQNEEGPWMFYCPPSKEGGREGPQMCARCRKKLGSDRQRATVIARNKAGK